MAADGTAGQRWVTALPPTPTSVAAARRFAREALDALGVPHTEEAAALLVSELTTNAVLHAGTRLRLSLYRRDGMLRVEVRDDDPHLPREVDPDPLQPGGRGILLVDMLAEDWGVNRNERGKTVWFELAA